MSANLEKKVIISVVVSRKQNVTKNLKSLYFDKAKKRINEGSVTKTNDANASGKCRKYVHTKNTDRISVLPTYIISFVIMPLFFGTVTCIYISMLNTNTNISLIIPNVLSTIVPPLLSCVIIVVLSQDRKTVDDK
jgi:hypothetical protein